MARNFSKLDEDFKFTDPRRSTKPKHKIYEEN